MLDACELGEITMPTLAEVTDSNQRYFFELMGKLSEGYAQVISNEYGKQVWCGRSFVEPRLQRSRMFAALAVLTSALCFKLGYESTFGESTHVGISRQMRRAGWTCVKRLECKDVTFENGKTVRGFLEGVKDSQAIADSLRAELWATDLRKLLQYEKYGEFAVQKFLERSIHMFKAKL